MKNSLLTLTTSLILATNLLAAEADNFNSYQFHLMNQADEINQLANKHLSMAIKKANQVGSCNQETLFKELRQKFANHTKGEFVIDLIYNHPELTQRVPLSNSIYYNWKASDGLALGLKKKKKGDLALSPLIQIKNQVIGVDKLEHMFGMGYHYYQQYYENNHSLNKVLSIGSGFEKYILGGSFYATGIFSYGDLAANFNGMRFWNNFLGKNPDILGKQYQISPYILCKDRQWITNPDSPIDFSHYVDQSMDESINCSKFARRKAADKIAYNVRELKKKTQALYCQENKQIFSILTNKYKPYGINNYILNYEGIRKFNFNKDVRGL